MSRWSVEILVILGVAGIGGAVLARRATRAPLGVILAVALGLRVALAILSRGHTPHDVAGYFQQMTVLIHHRRDPLTVLPRYQWNFLPFMPTLYALVDHLGLPWQYTVKVPAIAADLVSTVLVGSLLPERRRAVQWLYATSPVALLVTSVHGQVEPTAIALGLGALLLVRRRPLVAGALLGFAVAAKTWPLIFLPGLLAMLPWRSWWRVIVGTVIVPILFVIEALVVLHDHLGPMGHRLAGYRSLIGAWGWTGLFHWYGRAGTGYAGPHIDGYQTVGTVVLAVTALTTLVLLRRRPGPTLVLGLMLTFYAASAGFGVQYLMWMLPLALTQLRRWPAPLLVLASAYCAVVYLVIIPATDHARLWLGVEVFGSIPVIVAGLVALTELLGSRAGMPPGTGRLSPRPAPRPG